jgi:hypothetical protein
MKRFLVFLCGFSFLFAIAGSAWAVPIDFALDAGNSSVTLSNVHEAGAHLSADLYSGLGDTAFSLGDNQSQTFDFLTLSVDPTWFVGGGSAEITATLAFDQPDALDVTGSGTAIYAQLFGFISGEGLIWGPVDSPIYLTNGDYFDIVFNNLVNFCGDANVTATVTAHSAQVPEPTTALFLGACLLGLIFIGRKKLRSNR